MTPAPKAISHGLGAAAGATFGAFAGMSAAKRRCRDLHAHAVEALADFGEGAEHLRWLADFVIERNS